ncbi:MAG: hypothetical protein EAZ95_16215 [Bacteroidetes bacterium]|nr:MAG: hypothetical protein EAZ95_16215 [Bacteroidota bacterium]
MAKELIMEDSCWLVYADANTKTMEVVWLKPADLSDEGFKEYLRTFVDLLEKHQTKAFLVDSRLGHVVMTPDIQEWHDQEIIQQYVRLGIQKTAFILPADLFEATSIEQTFSEDMASHALKTQYFEDVELARTWLVA